MQVLCPDARARCIAAKKAAETATTVNAELARASRQGDAEEKSRDDEGVELACQADPRLAIVGNRGTGAPDGGGVCVRARAPRRAGRRRPPGRTGRRHRRLRQPGRTDERRVGKEAGETA